MIGHLDEDNLCQVYASTSTEVGGTTSFKLKKASPFFFGASMVEVHQVPQMSTNILEGIFMFFPWLSTRPLKRMRSSVCEDVNPG